MSFHFFRCIHSGSFTSVPLSVAFFLFSLACARLHFDKGHLNCLNYCCDEWMWMKKGTVLKGHREGFHRIFYMDMDRGGGNKRNVFPVFWQKKAFYGVQHETHVILHKYYDMTELWAKQVLNKFILWPGKKYLQHTRKTLSSAKIRL